MKDSREVDIADNEEILLVIKKENLRKYSFITLGIIILVGVYLSQVKSELMLVTGEKISAYFVPEKNKKAVESPYQPRNYVTMIKHISSIPGWNQKIFEEIEIATVHSKMTEEYQTIVTSYQDGDNFEELLKSVSEPDWEYDTEEGPFKIIRVTWRKRITEKSVIVITISYEEQSKQIVDKNYAWETL